MCEVINKTREGNDTTHWGKLCVAKGERVSMKHVCETATHNYIARQVLDGLNHRRPY